MTGEIKEWVKAVKPANGPTIITVTLQDGNLSAKWSTKAFDQIKNGVADARRRAHQLLDELREACALDEAA